MQQLSLSLRPTYQPELSHHGNLAPQTNNAKLKETCAVPLLNYKKQLLTYVVDGKLLKFHLGLVMMELGLVMEATSFHVMMDKLEKLEHNS